jgi:hypothetical protein
MFVFFCVEKMMSVESNFFLLECMRKGLFTVSFYGTRLFFT